MSRGGSELRGGELRADDSPLLGPKPSACRSSLNRGCEPRARPGNRSCQLASDNGLCDLIPITMAEPRKSDQPVQLYRLPPRNRALPVVQGNDCVVALRALGEDTRVRIVGLLLDQALDVGEIRSDSTSRRTTCPNICASCVKLACSRWRDGRTRLYALPDTIRGRAREGGVLDLGCCSFQFQSRAGSPSRQPRSPLSRRRSEALAGDPAASGCGALSTRRVLACCYPAAFGWCSADCIPAGDVRALFDPSGFRNRNAPLAALFDSICQSWTLSSVGTPRRNTLPKSSVTCPIGPRYTAWCVAVLGR